MTDMPETPTFESLSEVRIHTAAILDSLIGEHHSVSLFDIPTHENVGDNMIWEGELAYLRKLGKRVSYETDVFRHSNSTFDKLAHGTPILLHGGGNFGDIWPIFQDFRESVVRSYPDRRIIQLPQTVYFESPARAQSLTRHCQHTQTSRCLFATWIPSNVRVCPFQTSESNFAPTWRWGGSHRRTPRTPRSEAF